MKKKKKFESLLVSVKFSDRKSPIYGYVIDYNDDWTLVKNNPVDYLIDGYIIFRHKNIEGYRRDKEEKLKEKIIDLKGLRPKAKERVPIDDLETILKYLTKKFGVFQLYTKSERACYLGRLRSINSKKLVIDFLDTNGQWAGKMSFRPGDVRMIEFDNDYINSLKLLSRQ